MKGRIPTSKKKRVSGSQGQSAGVLTASVFGVCIGLLFSVVLALVCSTICVFSSDPDKLISPLSLFSLIAVYLSAGFIAAKKKAAAFPCGLISGGILALVFFTVSCFFDPSYSAGLALPIELLIRLSFVGVSLLGALLGVNVSSKGKRRKRRR